MRYIEHTNTLKLDETTCIGCGRCVEVCPHAVFKIKEVKADTIRNTAPKLMLSKSAAPAEPLAPKPQRPVAEIADKGACIECGACKRNCPVEAISVCTGVGCAFAAIKAQITGKQESCCC